MAVTLYKPQNKYEHSFLSLQRERNLVLRQPIQDCQSLKCDQENRECLLCYDQSQQRSRHVNWPQNHKLIKMESIRKLSNFSVQWTKTLYILI